MALQLAIGTLQQYKLCRRTRELASKYPFELKRRITYIDNLILQLDQAISNHSETGLLLIADDIRHCLLHNYYPLLSSERQSDNFNFTHTLEDVVQLIELNVSSIAAA